MSSPTQSTAAQLEALNDAIALHLQNRLADAEAGYRALIQGGAQIPEVFSNLARICSASGRPGEAVALLGQALQLNPGHLESLVLLGLALRRQGRADQAELCYRAALEVQADIPEVLYNLGNLLQERGEPVESEQCYRRALSGQPQLPLAHYNLGNLCRDQGRLDEAISHYRQAISQDPSSPLAHNNLGNALTHRDALAEAIASYRQALELQADFPDAMYNLGNALYLQGDLEQARPWFARSGIRDWRARCLHCDYKTGQVEAFTGELQDCLAEPHTSPQIAALSAHHACKTGRADPYRFCPRPLEHVYHSQLPELAAGSELRRALLETLSAVAMSERHQGRLHNGVQSAGNLFLRQEAPLQQLATLIRRAFAAYRAHYHDSDCVLIEQFPTAIEFESAWYIRMQQDGHLDAHIHETGWLSGVVYLALPAGGASGREGLLELGLHGDNYPTTGGAEFPTRVLQLAVGDIVLFPSSLFHRTIPFRSAQERICIAFDLKPGAGRRK